MVETQLCEISPTPVLKFFYLTTPRPDDDTLGPMVQKTIGLTRSVAARTHAGEFDEVSIHVRLLGVARARRKRRSRPVRDQMHELILFHCAHRRLSAPVSAGAVFCTPDRE